MAASFAPRAHKVGEAVLQPLAADRAPDLAQAIARIPPWSTVGYEASSLLGYLTADDPASHRYQIMLNGELAGIAGIRSPWLRGPYLQLLALLPPAQGCGVGTNILEWLEVQANIEASRQIWVCVSTFNRRAENFYRRFGFEPVAVLDALISEKSDELLMRKKLFQRD
jgi:GNAT superfamily N-acetyltransferase